MNHPVVRGNTFAIPVPKRPRLNPLKATALLILDPASGREIEWIPLPSRRDYPDAGSLLSTHRDDVYYADDRGVVWHLGLGRSAFEPIVEHRDSIRTFQPIATDSYIIFQDEGSMACVCSRSTGQLLWQAPAHVNARDLFPAAELPGGRVALGSLDGVLRIYDAGGQLLGTKKLGKRIFTPIRNAGGSNIVVGVGGELVVAAVTGDDGHAPGSADH